MKIHHIIYVWAALLLASCTSNEDAMQGPVTGKVNVSVSVNVPQSKTVDTRASADAEIKNVDVLLFDESNKFIERIKVDGSELTPTASGVTFKVIVDATPNKRIIHLVTNGRAADDSDRLNFNDLSVGMNETTAIRSLHTASLEYVNSGESTLLDNVLPLVMWGRFELTNGVSNGTPVSSVNLLRATACIQVKKDTPTNDNGLNNFVINGISVYKGVCHGYLAPTNCTGAVTTPTVANPATDGVYLDYQKGWSLGTEPSLYIYERKCTSSDYMSVLIKATYDGVTGYYRIALANTSGMLDIIRNHRYIVTIVGAYGAGHSTADAAIAAAPSNLKIEMTDSDGDFPCIIADGSSRMAVTNNVFSLYGRQNSSGTAGIKVATVYSNGAQPVVVVPISDSWIGTTSVNPIGGDKYDIMASFSSTADATHSTVIKLVCDNISQELTVRWNPVISMQSDGDSYVLDLVSTEKNWNVRVLEPLPMNWLAVHPTANTPGSFPGTGMLTELKDDNASHAYLHVGKGASRTGVVQMSSTDASGDETRANRIVIVQ